MITLSFPYEEKTNPQYKNHSDRGLGKKYFSSKKKPHPVNTDTLIKS